MKQLRDQLAHAGVVLLALAPALFVPCLLSGMFGAIVIGLLAELKEEDSDISLASIKAVLSSRSSLLDICGYAVCGAFLGALA